MSRYDVILFDLDGTLLDTHPGIIASLEHTFRTLGLPMYSQPEKFLGPPLPRSFREFCGMNEEETAEAVRIFREKYSSEELFNVRFFAGMEDTLRELKDRGYILAVATCKVEKYARAILEHFGLSHYFAFIGGSDEIRTQKSEVIAYVLDDLGVTDKSCVLMVGDRDNDINGAKAVGIPCLYALWGYGSAEEAEKFGADATAEMPADALKCIMHNS